MRNQVILHAGQAGIVQVLLAFRHVGFQRLDDGQLAGVERTLAGLFLLQGDQNFVGSGVAIALYAGILQPGAVQIAANLVVVGGGGGFQVNVGAALEVHSQRNAVPEHHAEDAGHAEDQREAEEIPLLP